MSVGSSERTRKVKPDLYGGCLAFLFLLQASAMAADSTDSVQPKGVRVNAGAGFGSKGLLWGVGAAVDHGAMTFSARFSHTFEFTLLRASAISVEEVPSRYVEDMSLHVGLNIGRGRDRSTLSIGPALIIERDRGAFIRTTHQSFLTAVNHFERVMISSLGLSLDTRHYRQLVEGFGIGITIAAVFSRRVVMVGGLLSIQLGS